MASFDGIILSQPVTSHMRTDFSRVRLGLTVEQVFQQIRSAPPEGRIVYFYVVDDQDRLKGVIPTRRLLLANPDAKIDDIMMKQVVGIPSHATVLEACEFFTLYKFLAFPVIGPDRELLGIVDVELYTGELEDLDQRESTEDIFQLIGVHLNAAERKTVFPAYRKRFPWLLCNVAGGLLAGLLTDLYADVSTLLVVTPFIPVVLALSESVAIQSVSLSIQLLHGQRPSWSMLRAALLREAIIGLFLGFSCGVIVGGIAFGWKGSANVGLSLMGGIAGGVLGAAVVGMSLPLFLRLARRDPSVASGPIALASADLMTLILYFNLCRLLLSPGN